MYTISTNMVRILLVLTWLILSSHQSPIESNQWVPYTTESHIDMGNRTAFSRRIYLYLKNKRRIPESRFKAEFNRWFILNLGHVFEEAALSSYSVLKNQKMYNGRIPDGVEDGLLEQFTHYTRYPASTFIEAKFMRHITLSDPRISGQLTDMIDFLSRQNLHTTHFRNAGSHFNRKPGRASQEELAILVFLTPANSKIHGDVIEYAANSGVKVYQMLMYHSFHDQTQLKLEKPMPLTAPSRHRFGHALTPRQVSCPWDRPIIDPDTNLPVDED